ncbi:thiol-disulfide oxidoreductase DCC family protein [Pseudomonas paraeruginosa]|uniref:Thiol-disulfide oxidoreductase DCC family protein n=2 Tax=Pseudomonas aeruginosa group TaxID=136841 RepID=A0ABD7K815_PSEAI|nr:thiol-disulfide oxidoreductase DCC family protein [Pseudomonas paraeruginosa]RTS50546.1 thiol-disulfide oxidoreductase DCC family protein [Pseudomonas aeruginosa]
MTAQKENSDSTPTSRSSSRPLPCEAFARTAEPGENFMSLPPYLQPGDKLVLYDEHCRFCGLWSSFLARRADARLKLCAAQSAEGRAILEWFGLAPGHFDTWLFIDGAYACDDSDALLEVLRLLPGPWRHLRWLRLLPAWLRDECHEALRRNRWHWFGRQHPAPRRRSWRTRRA